MLGINHRKVDISAGGNAPARLYARNFRESTCHARDQFRTKNEEGVRFIQDSFQKRFGRFPVIYGNNMMTSRYEQGSGGYKFYLLPTDEKSSPLDGMRIEDFMGGYDNDQWLLWRD